MAKIFPWGFASGNGARNDGCSHRELVSNMGERYVREVYDDDLHMGDSSDGDGSHRGLEFDDDNNLKGQAKYYEVDEKELYDELKEKYNEDDTEYIPEIDFEGLERKLQVGAFVAGFLREFGPEIKEWVKETAIPGVKTVFRTAKRKLKKNKLDAVEITVETTLDVTTDNCRTIANAIEVAEKQYRKKMTSEEAQQRLLRIVLHAIEMSKELNELANAEIADSLVLTNDSNWRAVEEVLSKESLIESINRILLSGEDSFNKEQIDMLEGLLNRELYQRGEYIPIDGDEIRGILSGSSENDDSAEALR